MKLGLSSGKRIASEKGEKIFEKGMRSASGRQRRAVFGGAIVQLVESQPHFSLTFGDVAVL